MVSPELRRNQTYTHLILLERYDDQEMFPIFSFVAAHGMKVISLHDPVPAYMQSRHGQLGSSCRHFPDLDLEDFVILYNPSPDTVDASELVMHFVREGISYSYVTDLNELPNSQS